MGKVPGSCAPRWIGGWCSGVGEVWSESLGRSGGRSQVALRSREPGTRDEVPGDVLLASQADCNSQ